MPDPTEREIASQLDTLITAAKAIPVTPEHREAALITEFLRQQLAAMDVQESLRTLVDEYRKHAASVEAQLTAERASKRKLRLTLRELTSRWSRYPEDGVLFDAWSAAERQLSSILDADL